MPPKSQPLSWPVFAFLALMALALGGFYRTQDLDARPMHLDEAILGVKYAAFSEQGWFDYDPSDYHGPALHYVTKVWSWLAGWGEEESITDAQLRGTVVALGLLLILLLLAVTDAMGRLATAMTMMLTAVSPMMVFYSRYYIMEMLFVLLLLLLMVCLWRYHQRRAKRWLLLAGCCFGALHATKETFIINVAAMACGWLAAVMLTEGFTQRSNGLRFSMGRSGGGVTRPWLWVLISGVVVSVALYSGFFRHWTEVLESVQTYGNYLKRSGGAGHEKPWNYYITLLTWHRNHFLWSELAIVVLATFGMARAFFGWWNKETHRQAYHIFLSVYALAALTAYSIIPYKTPWTILSVQSALTMLAGAGVEWLYALVTHRILRTGLTVVMTAVIYNLCGQCMMTLTDRGQPNMRAPYVYSHTAMAARHLFNRIEELEKTDPDGFSMQVVNQDSGWPLGWYFRHLKDKIGYHTTAPEDLPFAPILVVDRALRDSVLAKFPGKLFDEDFFNLREGVPLSLLVEKPLSEAWQQKFKPRAAPVRP